MSSKVLLITFIALIFSITLSTQQGSNIGNDAIHLTQIKSITLYKNAWTTARRSHPVPQLKCISKPDNYEPDQVECSYEGNGWRCNAKLRSNYKFGKMNVNCEGYRYSGDDLVLKGSCGLEYTLEYNQKPQSNQQQQHYRHEPIPSNPSSLGSFWIVIIVLVVIGCIWLSKQNSSSTIQSNNQQPYPSMYPDVNPNYNPDLHQTFVPSSSSSQTSSTIPTFLAGAAAGYAASSLYNSQRNSGATGGNGSYFESSSNDRNYGNHYSNYENQTYHSYSHHDDDDDTRDHTVYGISTTSR
ncbi:predicted protein [Naegleria gruberi]|uniref:Store-operated calcium entry-associated regulatory factor n=1 Tax=Naegleria gruberi TaxID=5762 RepID=D2VVA4_NAEGR|nr:uncharacterized protein NAEGRDRAFT_72946 [Naegleria gruberi]EFC39199.1 predicted protein [Naegleria gruberi]|eukprot:XP_002671943.1 predicted protein [Naegleria gruberi strain NEG-M]